MQVREVMTANPACCLPDASLQEIARMMVDNDCGLIPVVSDNTSKKPVGTITDRDITIRTVALGKNPLDLKASDIMTTGVINITPEMSVEDCFNVMEDQEIRRVLVVDQNGACCGIVAQADVAQIGTNPERTARLVREISESSPSRKVSYGSRDNQYSSGGSTMMKSDSVLPLLIGMGAGAALMYFLKPEQDSYQNTQNRSISTYQPMTTKRVETNISTDKDSTSEGNFQGLRTDISANLTDTYESSDESNLTASKKAKRRSATPGSSY